MVSEVHNTKGPEFKFDLSIFKGKKKNITLYFNMFYLACYIYVVYIFVGVEAL